MKQIKQDSLKFHIVKYKSLLHKLELVSDVEEAFFSACNNLKAESLFYNGTDFFWSSIHYLDTAIDTRKSIKMELMAFQIHFWDSFFHILPEGQTLSLPKLDSNYTIILPSLGIKFLALKEKSYKLQKKGEKSFDLKLFSKDVYSLNFNLTDLLEFQKLKGEVIDKEILYLYESNNTFYQESDFEDCSQDEVKNFCLCLKVKNALQIIKGSNLFLYNKILDNLDFIIPFGNEEGFVYPNFAIASLKKTIFLSVDLLQESNIQVAESIIHELAHCELHIIQDTELLTNIEHGILEYYSPWRKDKRPLLGLIHGIFVTKDILAFYSELSKSSKQYIEQIDYLCHQTLVAYDEMKIEDLTETGREIINSIIEEVKVILTEFELSVSTPPDSIEQHKLKWKKPVAILVNDYLFTINLVLMLIKNKSKKGMTRLKHYLQVIMIVLFCRPSRWENEFKQLRNKQS